MPVKTIKYRNDSKGCHVLTSHISSRRYGSVKRFKGAFSMHRLIFYIFNGYFPQVVMHSCDNPFCINPNHLLPGNHQLNSDDKVKKGRQVKGVKNGGGNKLDGRNIKRIRNLIKKGITLQKIADEYDVCKKMILNIKQKKKWKHIK